jgi:hypothetical protein
VILLLQNENIVSEAKFHKKIVMNKDYEICKYSQPHLFSMGDFNVARI